MPDGLWIILQIVVLNSLHMVQKLGSLLEIWIVCWEKDIMHLDFQGALVEADIWLEGLRPPPLDRTAPVVLNSLLPPARQSRQCQYIHRILTPASGIRSIIHKAATWCLVKTSATQQVAQSRRHQPCHPTASCHYNG